jgi:hypothetical protein
LAFVTHFHRLFGASSMGPTREIGAGRFLKGL